MTRLTRMMKGNTMKRWQLQHAKAHFSEVVKEAVIHGPQEITLRGEPAVVILSKKEYDKLTVQKPSFIQFLRQSPLMGLKLPLKRRVSKTRKVDL